ncbi:hypothetical protein ORL36_16415 [Klebsiella pasteurii]|nr:hypothetical protein [Klebsiella pasteurii]MCW9586200.1 hypothetical protein [Klebsiella pasteurii]
MEAEQVSLQQKNEKLALMNLEGRITDEFFNTQNDQITAALDHLKLAIKQHKQSMDRDFPSKLVTSLDLSKKEDRAELQRIVQRYVSVIRMNGKTQTADITMQAGFVLHEFPLSYVVDGQQWIELLHDLGVYEYTFTDRDQPLSQMLKNAPEWVADAIDQDSYRQPAE